MTFIMHVGKNKQKNPKLPSVTLYKGSRQQVKNR